jgi:hypothetical protein
MMRSIRMPTRSYPKWNLPKHWRLRGTATDGLTVTLGRYETEEEAHADSTRLALGGTYRDLVVQPIPAKPSPEANPA